LIKKTKRKASLIGILKKRTNIAANKNYSLHFCKKGESKRNKMEELIIVKFKKLKRLES
jgi:uncharacterized protein (DUF2132 family)